VFWEKIVTVRSKAKQVIQHYGKGIEPKRRQALHMVSFNLIKI
jgi:hypothetical protein